MKICGNSSYPGLGKSKLKPFLDSYCQKHNYPGYLRIFYRAHPEASKSLREAG